MEIEPGKLGVGFICLLQITFLCTVFFPSDFDLWTQKLLSWRSSPVDHAVDQELMELHMKRLMGGEGRVQLDKIGFACSSDYHTDVCVATKPVRINTKDMTVYVPGPRAIEERVIKPYTFKSEKLAMGRVSPVKIVHGSTDDLPPCQFTHSVPASIFSTGGYSNNTFHDIDNNIIPLFLTSNHFRKRLQFIATDFKASWVRKYSRVLSMLSLYNVINPAADGSVHCFPGAVIGLVYHDLLKINSTEIPFGYSMPDFREFLRKSYGLKHKNVAEIEKPLLVLISRTKSRMFLNEQEMVLMMEQLGFQVTVASPEIMSDLEKFSDMVNSCKVLVGAHGAGLTNMVFLPDEAVEVQVTPLGLDWAASYYYGEESTSSLGLKYLEYLIDFEESSLLDHYGMDHPVISNPLSILMQGYKNIRAYYFDEQQLKINVRRFRKTLVEAMHLIGGSNPLEPNASADVSLKPVE